MGFDASKFIAKFADEARDHLTSINKGLVELDKNHEDTEIINSLFRAAHTIKGSSRMLKLTQVTEVAHALEDALGAIREKRLAITADLSNLMFKAADILSGMIKSISAGDAITSDNTQLCDALKKAAEGALVERGTAGGEEDACSRQSSSPVILEGPEESLLRQHPRAASTDSIRVRSDKLDDMIRLMGEVVSYQNKLKQRILDISMLEKEAKRVLESCSTGTSCASVSNVRSLHSGLKHLLSLVRQDKTLQDILTGEFQEKALRLRMVPLSTIFDPLPRLVRDISHSLGKNVDFEIEGGDIELDRKMVEKLSDPLLHMLRNALDHGIEMPQMRQSSGKPPKGRVRLFAAYDAGSILIELSDDGAGISVSGIKEKAVEKRLFDPAALDAMSEQSLLDLIFLPGFSTSGIITDISGRGVGMDIVKKNIVEELKGSVIVRTKEGRGSEFIVRLPMSLAIMRVMLISCGDMKFGITTHYATEIIRAGENEIIDIVNRKAIRLRNEFIPVVDMRAVLGIEGKGNRNISKPLILMAQIGAEKLGFIIDAVLEEEDMVIKPLPDHLKKISFVSGVTISGRNEVINILNIPALIASARSGNISCTAAKTDELPERDIRILVVDDSVNTREIEKSILEAYGYKVAIAGDGKEALAMADEVRYDLIITDVEMPHLDGFSLTERLRANEAYRDIPIIMVTSRGKDEDRRRGMSVGADAYIIKGAFDQNNLVVTVQSLIGRGQAI